MALVVVTSCSLEGWDKYGLKFLTSFDQFWPADVQLHIVSEDPIKPPDSILRKRPQIRLWDLNKSKDAVSFAQKHESNPVANGFRPGCPIAAWRSKKTGYDYRRDAFRFSKKVFAINLVLPEIKAPRFIWLDADTVTLKGVPPTLFDKLPPHTHALAYLDRTPYHSECGFVGYNLEHVATRRFLKAFADIYASEGVFKLDEWHDSYVFDWLRRRHGVPSFPIPYDRRHITHPFVYSELGQYMDHLKGLRKQRGVSHDHPRFHQGRRDGARVGVRYVRQQQPHRPRMR